MQQVTERLDRLISQIKEIQEPHVLGGKPVDILLVRLFSLSSLLRKCPLSPSIYLPALPTATQRRELQVAHGLILRCFMKRWIGLTVDQLCP